MALCIVERQSFSDTNFHVSYFYFIFLLYFILFFILYRYMYIDASDRWQLLIKKCDDDDDDDDN